MSHTTRIFRNVTNRVAWADMLAAPANPKPPKESPLDIFEEPPESQKLQVVREKIDNKRQERDKSPPARKKFKIAFT